MQLLKHRQWGEQDCEVRHYPRDGRSDEYCLLIAAMSFHSRVPVRVYGLADEE